MVLTTILAIVYGILGGILFFKVWRMCNDVRDIKNAYLAHSSGDNIPPSFPEPKPSDGEKFSIGQLVIVKQDEAQFRISSIEEVEGSVRYFSGKLNKSFLEEEIEDFDIYWKKKKSAS